jgi:putative Mg2+ transporter-C (MgtC) family protein
MDTATELRIIGEVALALFLGGVIGFERETAQKPAGFRTHMLVAASAALFMSLADLLVGHFRASTNVTISSDPIRVIEAVITGISFLGAGTIFRHRDQNHVEGLTTAASLLFSGAVGISVALHHFVLALGVVALALFVLRGVGMIERRIGKDRDT